MYFHFLVSFSYSICRDQPNLTAMRLWFYLQLYRYIADPTRTGKGDIIEKSPYPTYKGIELWIDLKLNLESGIEWWTELRWNIDGWIELWVKFRCNEHREELNSNWIQTPCLNLNWFVNPKLLNRYISAMQYILTRKLRQKLYTYWKEGPNEHTASFLNIWYGRSQIACHCEIWSDTNFNLYNRIRHVSRSMHFLYVFVAVFVGLSLKIDISVCAVRYFTESLFNRRLSIVNLAEHFSGRTKFSKKLL